MSFESVLFAGPGEDGDLPERGDHDALRDLNLDQLIDVLTAGRDEYDLKTFFQRPLASVEDVAYRHEVFTDLADEHLRRALDEFGRSLAELRRCVAQLQARYYPRQKQRWLLDGVSLYCQAVVGLSERLEELQLGSRALRSLRSYLAAYCGGEAFRGLAQETAALVAELREAQYCISIQGRRVNVGPLTDEADYGAEVDEFFARFKQGAVKDYRVQARDSTEMDHVEAQILEGVAQLHRQLFERLASFGARRRDFADETVLRFDREIQFYLAYCEVMRRLRECGLEFSLPVLAMGSKKVRACDTFDFALALKLVGAGQPVVCNDVQLQGAERILVVTGPNNGGKTTFARTLGQLHHLASLGCPVPGRDVQLPLVDRVLTHFEREEDLQALSGKLESDLTRVHDILGRATDRSLVVMNESFSSTTLADALFVGTRVLAQLIERDLIAVYVTFVDELASLGEQIVSMMSTVEAEDPARRTFKVVRKPADGLAHAAAIATRYRLSPAALRERLTS